MSKVLDWNAMYKGSLRGSRGKYGSYRELMEKKAAQVEEFKKAAEHQQMIEPHLKKGLLDYMVNRKPIKVLAPIQYYTESFMQKSFETTLKTVPVGTELVFSHIDKTMGQWIFKSSTGEEVDIYDTPIVTIPGANRSSMQVKNPGFFGLLYNTNIFQEIMEEVNNA